MENKLLKKLGNNIRHIRRQRGWTQERLAEAARIHPVYICNIEKGSQNPSITKIFQIIEALECEFNDIFEGMG